MQDYHGTKRVLATPPYKWQSGNISEYMPVLFSFKADTSKKYLYKNYFMILLLALLLNILYKNLSLQSSNLCCPKGIILLPLATPFTIPFKEIKSLNNTLFMQF